MALNRLGGRWLGGYVSKGAGGAKTFVIERMVAGIRWHVSTRCHTERAALKQLERFEANPRAYSPSGEESDAPVTISLAMADEWRDWSLRRGVSRKHANEMRRLLDDWELAFHGRDLRALTASDLRRHAEGAPGEQHRIIAIKSFCGYLRRQRGVLGRADDPTLDLPVPQARPEKWRRRKAVELDRLRAAYWHLAGTARDAFSVLCATGMHWTELDRFVHSPDSTLEKVVGAVGVITVRHKSGRLARIVLGDREAFDAAARLKAGGVLPTRPNEQLRRACVAAKVEPFTFGVLRHTVATYAMENGASLSDVATLLGHQDARTTARFYADVSVPPAVPTPSTHLADTHL